MSEWMHVLLENPMLWLLLGVIASLKLHAPKGEASTTRTVTEIIIILSFVWWCNINNKYRGDSFLASRSLFRLLRLSPFANEKLYSLPMICLVHILNAAELPVTSVLILKHKSCFAEQHRWTGDCAEQKSRDKLAFKEIYGNWNCVICTDASQWWLCRAWKSLATVIDWKLSSRDEKWLSDRKFSSLPARQQLHLWHRFPEITFYYRARFISLTALLIIFPYYNFKHRLWSRILLKFSVHWMQSLGIPCKTLEEK